MTASKPLVYVAGPITSNPFGCVREAAEAWTWLRDLGCVPFFPQLSVLHEMVDPQPYETWLGYDFDVIMRCDALVRLPGESAGADREIEWAAAWGVKVFIIGPDGVQDGTDETTAILTWLEQWSARQAAS